MAQAVADVIEQLSSLPPFPRVTTKLLRLLDDGSVSLDDLASVISSDPSLVMKVIHIANSPFYMCSRPVESVKDAVLILGINAIKSITTAVSVQKGLRAFTPRTDVFDQTQFWKHSYATAIMARKLMHRIDKRQSDKFYLVGLIHDVGKLIQAFYWPDTWQAAVNLLRQEATNYETVETRVFSCSHSEITAQLCTNWQFPEEIVELMTEQTRAAKGEVPLAEMSVLSKANLLANYAEFVFPVEQSYQFDESMTAEYTEILSELPAEVAYQLRVLEK